MSACGRFRVEDEVLDRAVGRGSARELLALLVLHRGRPLSVAEVVDALWLAEPPATARTIVHGAVSRLRKALGAAAVRLVDDGYVLDEELLEVDLWVGLDLLASGRATSAAAVLTPPLLGPYASRPWAAPSLADLLSEVHAATRREHEPWIVEPTGPASTASRMVGRRRELQAVAAALRQSRLVTIVGLGGVGKSRLATEALLDVQGTVVRADLARGGGSFTDGLTGAIGAVPALEGGVAAAMLGNLLDGVDLLVVDGCELDVDGAADAIALLLRRRLRLRVLATSRTALGVAGEHLVPLLPFDDPGDPRGDAVELLLDRVRSLGLPFVEGDRERAATICRSCAGVPLAIELAAAGLLDGDAAPQTPARAPALVVRQRIDGAVAGLTATAVVLARRLAVLNGGTTVGLAGRLDPQGGASSVRELLSAGLLAVEPGAAGRRFHLLDTVRDTLLEQVDVDDRIAAARALTELASPASPPAGAGPDLAALGAAVPEIENAHGLLRSLAADGRHGERLALARAFAVPWSERGYNTFAGEELLAAARSCVEAGELDPVGWAEVVAQVLDVLQSFEAAAEQLDLTGDALVAAHGSGRDDLVAWLEFERACGFGYRGEMGEAIESLMVARDAAERAGAEGLELRIRSLLAVAWWRTGDREGPRAAMEDVTRRLAELAWYGQAARSCLGMAQLARADGDRELALADVRRGEEHAAAGLSRVSLVWLRLEHAELELELDGSSPLRTDLESVRATLQSTVEVADVAGQLRIAGMCRVRLGVLDGDVGRLADAATSLLPVDGRCAALALASLHPLLGRSHPLRRLLPGVVAELAARPGLLVSDADAGVVASVAALADERLPADWEDRLAGALLDLAAGA